MDNKIKILLADDSAFMRKILKDILVGMGFSSFVEAGDGKEAIAQFEAEKPGLVLLDVIMPQMDGIEVLKAIGQKANVIIVSAVGQEQMIEEAKGHGAKGYIVKPFDKKQVEEEVKKVLG